MKMSKMFKEDFNHSILLTWALRSSLRVNSTTVTSGDVSNPPLKLKRRERRDRGDVEGCRMSFKFKTFKSDM